jgi:hypothetical protein
MEGVLVGSWRRWPTRPWGTLLCEARKSMYTWAAADGASAAKAASSHQRLDATARDKRDLNRDAYPTVGKHATPIIWEKKPG